MMARTSSVVTSRTGLAPMAGTMFLSKYRRGMVVSARSLLTISRKKRSPNSDTVVASAAARLANCFCCAGDLSMAAACAASSRFRRAFFSVSAGYLPSVSFSRRTPMR